ncbi:MAG: signal recognition particle protein [Dehalococcoidia bacterium]|jgi:signal recognition particle subunit SRP54|nr:signal recognition particle protein [Dehalococcoidia bacterium]|tara:strand:- start:939 stop:2282 length:1344 start_codon:yes stop_codon:yes gene_type:complete
MFENLSAKLSQITRKLINQRRLNENDINDFLRQIRMALLEADVNFKVVKSLIESIKNETHDPEFSKSLNPGYLLVEILKQQLITILTSDNSELVKSNKNCSKILLVGIQGSGKTTTAAKLSFYLNKLNQKTLLVANDLVRPAAIDQLIKLANDNELDIYYDKKINDSIKIAENSLKLSSDNQYQWTIIDTAGRSQLDDEMMKELITIKNKVNPEECILVVDSMIGQTAVDIANSFNEKLGLTGLIITKLDGDSKGGSAVSIVKETGLPIKFIGTGEKVDEFDKFYPDRISSRILGMGDLQTLAEKASEQIDHQKAEDLTKKIVSDSFDFNDLLDQMNSIKKMGSLESIINMIPGVNLNQMGSKLSENESKMNKMKYMIDSMTPIERRNPNILNVSRRKRIATGSGLTHIEVNQLINQFNQTKKMMKSFYGKNGRNLNKLIKSGNFPN